MKNLLAFLVGWLLAAVLLIPQARAAVTVAPMVNGYSGASGRFASGASGFSMTAANDGYIAPSVTNVGGRSVTMPATMRMAANAGQIAKNAMRLSPMSIAATLAAGWLLDQGVEWMADSQQWVREDPNYVAPEYPYGLTWGHGYVDQPCYRYGPGCDLDSAAREMARIYGGTTYTLVGYTITSQTQARIYLDVVYQTSYGAQITVQQSVFSTGNPAPSVVPEKLPMTQDDWDALPDPLPVVAPELPYAPYMPDGAPVTAPEYAPQTVPVGDPYTRADGSTAQPMARISPAGPGQVTIDTYDQPLTDPSGNPVVDPQPEDTAEPDVDPCEANPGRLGCMDAGTDTFPALQKETHTMSFSPEASPINGSCPAPISMPGGHVLTFDSACDAMVQIRPIVLALAGVMTAFMVVGVMRS